MDEISFTSMVLPKLPEEIKSPELLFKLLILLDILEKLIMGNFLKLDQK